MGSKQWGFAALFLGVALAGFTGGVSLGLIGTAGAGGAVFVGGVAASTIGAWLTGATLAANLIAGTYAARDARRAANASLQDRVTTIRSTDDPRAMLFGLQRVGGVLTYVSPPFGPNKESITLVITLVGHPCDGFESIWINDEPVTIDPSTGVVTGGPSGKWGARILDFDTYTGTTPAVWDAGSPSANRIAAPTGATGVVSVSWRGAADLPWVLAQPGVDYLVIPNSFDVGILSATLPGSDIAITYTKRVVVGGSIKIRTWTGYETGDDRRDTELETNSGGEWKSTSVGEGICRMHVTLTYDETMFADGLPSFSAVVRGARVYDPRKDSTNGGSGAHRTNNPATWEWTRNPALAARHYLTHEWGLGVANSRIDDAMVITAANACETQITLRTGYTESQFAIDGFLSTSQAPIDNLDEICGAMGGFAAPSGSKWRIVAGTWAAPAADAKLYDKDVIGDAELAPYLDSSALFNSVRGRYRDETTWAITDYPTYSSATYVAVDGQAFWKDIDLPLTLNPIRAQRVAKLSLFIARQALTYSATFTMAAWRYQRGDRLRLMLTEYGWDTVSQDSGTGKVFRVAERAWVFPDQVRLVLVEDTAAVYAWDYSEASTPDPTPNTTLPSASLVQAPTNVEGSASAVDFTAMPDGTKVGFVKITWDAITDSGVLAGGWLELRWKRAGEPADAIRIVRVSPYSTEYRLEGIRQSEVLNIGLVAVNASQARSSTTPIEGNVDGLANGVFSVQTAFVVAAGGTLFSGNLLANATFEFDTHGWSSFAEAGITYSTSLSKPTGTDALPGPPSANVVLYEGGQGQSSATAGAVYLTTAAAYVVQPGERYASSARFVLDGADAICHIQWLDANNAVIGAGAYGSTITQASPGNPTLLDGYTTHEAGIVYGTAPTNAKYARPYYIKLGTKVGSTASAAYVTQPMFYELMGADAVALWAPGSSGAITTGRIMLDAVSSRYLAPYDAAGMTLTPATVQFANMILGNVVADHAGDVLISVTCEVAGSASGGASTLTLGIYQDAKLSLIQRQVLVLADGQSGVWTGTLTATMKVEAGETIEPRLRLSRTRFGLSAGNTTDVVRKIDANFVLYKR